jgi:choline dehydrogenase-like flavoprotein
MHAPDGTTGIGSYDHVIIGAGSAGCLLAERLSADPATRVLVIEAGGNDNWIWLHIPVGYLFAIGNPRADWCFRTEPEPGLNGRAIAYPRGKVIGGSSSINAMLYLRGQRADYDGWRQTGLTGWGWDDVCPLFRGMEDHASPDEHHGKGGHWHVDFPRMRWDLLDAWAAAATCAGIPKVADFNTGDNEGVCYFQVNQKHGRRWSAARGFLKPALARSNLRLETGALVERIVVEDGEAKGVVFSRGGERFFAHASRETILSAGAVGSPHVLELSGIGDGARLQALGLPCHAHVPGIGENLQDHLQLRPVFRVQGVRTLNTDYRKLWRKAAMALEFALLRRGPLTMAPSQVGAFTRSDPRHATPNIEFHVQPLSLDRFGEPLHPFPAFTSSVCNLRPTSRGSIHAASPDPRQPPAIRPNYLSTEDDRQVAVESLRLARRIAASPPLARYAPAEFRPGAHLTSDGDLMQAAGDIGTTIFHPVGTVAMGADASAPLDGRLRMRAVGKLRVVDASVMPRIVSSNTNSPTLMIAEKAAKMIAEDARR